MQIARIDLHFAFAILNLQSPAIRLIHFPQSLQILIRVNPSDPSNPCSIPAKDGTRIGRIGRISTDLNLKTTV
jgi:hypothetical protein